VTLWTCPAPNEEIQGDLQAFGQAHTFVRELSDKGHNQVVLTRKWLERGVGHFIGNASIAFAAPFFDDALEVVLGDDLFG
jgi:hypothetical protein